MRVYLSGPISGIADFKARFARAAALIASLHPRIEVLNPVDFEGQPSWTWGEWMVLDLAMLHKHATHVVFLPGWKGSPGARVEREFASGLGLPMIELVDDDLAARNPLSRPALVRLLRLAHFWEEVAT